MKMRILTEDAHIAIGAGLSGMEVQSIDLQDVEDALAQWNRSIEDPSVGVLVVTEQVLGLLRLDVERHRQSGALPLTVVLPAYGRLMREIDASPSEGNDD